MYAPRAKAKMPPPMPGFAIKPKLTDSLTRRMPTGKKMIPDERKMLSSGVPLSAVVNQAKYP